MAVRLCVVFLYLSKRRFFVIFHNGSTMPHEAARSGWPGIGLQNNQTHFRRLSSLPLTVDRVSGAATVSPASTLVNNLRLPGQFFDSETGFHYNWHRYYEPGLGRYLTPDPIGLDGGVNLYVYLNGNPVNDTDISGLGPIDKFVKCANKAAAQATNFAQSDDLRHCYASCMIAKQCGLGTWGSAFVGVGKEVLDLFGPENAEFRDLLNDAKGNICAKQGVHPSAGKTCCTAAPGDCAKCCSCLKQGNKLN